MSDYLFSSAHKTPGFLTNSIEAIYHNSQVEVYEYHGQWGSLAVSKSHYSGFQPFENEQFLMVVIGGPVLYFRDNEFLVQDDSNTASLAIFNRWVVEGIMEWDQDLSGPFTVILIDKQNGGLKVVTDLMSFIPVYACCKNGTVYMGTHIDALSRICDESENFDQVSLADFVINSAVTYPYTAYINIRQQPPASVISIENGEANEFKTYWLPLEKNNYKNINEAADALRSGIESYVDRITNNMDEVAQFISGGEDSRSLSSIIPGRLNRNAFIFLNHMNREGRVAKTVAGKYGAKFNVGYRSHKHYLDILPEASDLVGSCHQYTHAHSLGFDKQFNLAKYKAVFGGYLSDSLLKAPYANKINGIDRFSFFPDIVFDGETRSKPLKNDLFLPEIMDELNLRRQKRMENILEIRPESAHEWFVLWPTTMRIAIPNFYSTRRLFKSYEPFMCNEVVKVSASVPTAWKTNRKLFNAAMKPHLRKTKWVFHADGRLPYFKWWFNLPIQFCLFSIRTFSKITGLTKKYQGPWADWRSLLKHEDWKAVVSKQKVTQNNLNFLKRDADIHSMLLGNRLDANQKINLLQAAYFSNK